MGYLDPGEYVAYGLDAETPDGLVTMASALLEGYCRRPTLLVQEYVERMRLARNAQMVRLSYGPVASVTGARVRLGRGGSGWSAGTAGLWFGEVAAAFGLPGTWSDLDPTQLDLNAATGELSLGGNMLGLPYNEVEVTYQGGCAEATSPIKVACAQVVRNAQAMPALNVRGSRMDTLQMQYFSGELVDASVQTLLRPYVASRVC